MPRLSMICQKIPIAGRLALWYNTTDIEVSSQQSVGIAGEEDACQGVFFHARNGGLALGESECLSCIVPPKETIVKAFLKNNFKKREFVHQNYELDSYKARLRLEILGKV